MLRWLEEYSSTIKRRNPFWVTMFNGTQQAYFLDIMRADKPLDLLARVGDAASWHQTEFDYAR